MLTIDNDTVHVDRLTNSIKAYRLEDTTRAPAIIVFVDQEKPQLLPIAQGQAPPTRVRSRNMEQTIEVITYAEVNRFLVGEGPKAG